MLTARQSWGHLSRLAISTCSFPSAAPLGNFEPRRYYSGDPGPSTVRLNKPKYGSRLAQHDGQALRGSTSRLSQTQSSGYLGSRNSRNGPYSGRRVSAPSAQSSLVNLRPPLMSPGLPAAGPGKLTLRDTLPRGSHNNRDSRDGGNRRDSRGKHESGTKGAGVGPRGGGAVRRRHVAAEQQVDARGRPVRDRPAGPNLGENPTTYSTARVLKEFLDKHPSPMSEQDVNAAVKIVIFAPRQAQNAVVYNMMLAMIGKERKLERMYKAFIDMKKRGIVPTSRTYVTLLNAYAGVPHSQVPADFVPSQRPEMRTMNRILAIYQGSQDHLVNMIAKVQQQRKLRAAKKDIGLAVPSSLSGAGSPSGQLEVEDEDEDAEDVSFEEEEITLAPTNAYLKLLARYGMWKEMDQVHSSMDSTGPLAPDNITYSTLLASVLNRHALQFMTKPQPRNPDPGHPNLPRATELIEPFEIGPSARLLWDQAVRQFHGPSPPKDTGSNRYIDERLAVLALHAFVKARPADQRLAVSLIPFLWNLERPVSGVKVASMDASGPRASSTTTDRVTEGIPEFMQNIPPLRLTVSAATSIVSILFRSNQATLASGYAKQFLSTPEIRSHADFAFLNTCVHALSNTGDIDAVLDILNNFQAPNGKEGWAAHIWANALTTCRWAGDWPAALDIWRRMTHLRLGVEEGQDAGEYKWKTPNGKPKDIRGRRWLKPDPCDADAKALSLLLKTALSSRTLPHIRQAYRVLAMYNLDLLLTIPPTELKLPTAGAAPLKLLSPPPPASMPAPSPALNKALEWRLQLARDVQSVVERLVEGNGNDDEAAQMRQIAGEMERVLRRFGFRGDDKGKRTGAVRVGLGARVGARQEGKDEARLVEDHPREQGQAATATRMEDNRALDDDEMMVEGENGNGNSVGRSWKGQRGSGGRTTRAVGSGHGLARGGVRGPSRRPRPSFR